MATIVRNYVVSFSICVLFFYVSAQGQDSINKLPHCHENKHQGLLLVSTLDGKVTTLDARGVVSWQIDTGPGPLLTSNIHQLELTNNGQWIRIIPSLSGSLYKFDGAYIDAIPITAESLLKSSFRYSEDLVIAGGLEVRTYGVTLHSGIALYECSSLNCKNTTDAEDNGEDVAVIERSTRTVRAIEPRTGIERWNFSVGYHNIKMPQISCINSSVKFDFNVTAVIPDGILTASYDDSTVKYNWQYKFNSPIVNIWKWNGQYIKLVDLFNANIKREVVPTINKGIYLGMHNKQLYIHESVSMLDGLEVSPTKEEITESHSSTKIPWKPVLASDSSSNTALVSSEIDSTALSILYASEYVNGNGYYLFAEADKKDAICDNNGTIKLLPNNQDEFENYFINSIWYWWKEIVIISIITVVLNVVFKFFSRNRETNEQIIYMERHVEVPIPHVSSGSTSSSDSSEMGFKSRFEHDFETICCLGKGGFGVVFKVKQKIDECDYAIKRITLPKEQNSRDRVMREVKALAKLDHHNIIRYFNSWVENPPCGWQQEHDQKYIPDASLSFFATNTFNNSRLQESTSVDISRCEEMKESINYEKEPSESFIVFEDTSVDTCPVDQTTSLIFNASTENTASEEQTQSDGHSLLLANKQGTAPQRSTPMYLYIQMQLCRKESLKDWLFENKERDINIILDMFSQIVCAVEYVHLRGLIHRDLKPSNIFFSLEGQIKVGDFGLVTDMSDSEGDGIDITHSPRGHTKAVGTSLYMSPEQYCNQQYNYKVDIYSLGLIFFELLIPFNTDMERVTTLRDLKDGKYPVDFQSRYPKEHDLLNIMLSHDPKKRPTTIGIKARPPLQQICADISSDYHFDLPLNMKVS